VALAVYAVALAVAPAAGAGTAGPSVSLGKSHGLEYMRAKFNDVTTQVEQSAGCDGDGQVTGGGGSIDGPAAFARLRGSYPFSSPGTGWNVQGTSIGADRTLAAFAVCGGIDVDYEVTGLSSFPANSVVHGGASCPIGADPIAGGARATAPVSEVTMIATFPLLPPSTAGWRTPLANPSPTEDTLYEGHAVCSSVYDVRYQYSDPKRLRSGEAANAVARCRAKQSVLGGGFFSVRADVTGYRSEALTTRPWDSKQDGNKTPDDGWLARAYNRETFRVHLVAVAVCKR